MSMRPMSQLWARAGAGISSQQFARSGPANTASSHRFLLQYTSRAEVGLLKKGSGGIQEVKETVVQYVEPSPLYGFVQYRRRKVLLKYVPEGTSRLLQGEERFSQKQKKQYGY